jgi:hypothetical protein
MVGTREDWFEVTGYSVHCVHSGGTVDLYLPHQTVDYFGRIGLFDGSHGYSRRANLIDHRLAGLVPPFGFLHLI